MTPWPGRKATGMCAFGDAPATTVVELRISEYAGSRRGKYISGASRTLCDHHAKMYLRLVQGAGTGTRNGDERRTGVDRRD